MVSDRVLVVVSWVGVSHGPQPFVDEGHSLHSYFPARELAIKIPVVLLIVGITLVFTFISLVMIKTAQKKKKSS
jgi:hypothetical protein